MRGPVGTGVGERRSPRPMPLRSESAPRPFMSRPLGVDSLQRGDRGGQQHAVPRPSRRCAASPSSACRPSCPGSSPSAAAAWPRSSRRSWVNCLLRKSMMGHRLMSQATSVSMIRTGGRRLRITFIPDRQDGQLGPSQESGRGMIGVAGPARHPVGTAYVCVCPSASLLGPSQPVRVDDQGAFRCWLSCLGSRPVESS